jgi:hypothetical protein
MGVNCEHSHADAPVLAHLAEYNITEEWVMSKTIIFMSEQSSSWVNYQLHE